jgi:hypothetical protein
MGGRARSRDPRSAQSLEPISQMGNGCVAGDLALGQGASREQILAGSVADEQRSSGVKDLQPSGRNSDGLLAALLLSHRARGYAPSSRLASTRQSFAHPFSIHEIGSGFAFRV